MAIYFLKMYWSDWEFVSSVLMCTEMGRLSRLLPALITLQTWGPLSGFLVCEPFLLNRVSTYKFTYQESFYCLLVISLYERVFLIILPQKFFRAKDYAHRLVELNIISKLLKC